MNTTKMPQMHKYIARLRNSDLLSSAGIYLLSGIIAKAIPFFLLPVLTRYLAPRDYGIVATFTAAVGIFIPFVGVNTNTALARNYFDLDEKELPHYIGDLYKVILFATVVVLGVVFAFRKQIGGLLELPSSILFAMVLIAGMTMAITILLTLLQLEKAPIKYSALSLGNTLLNIGLSLFFVVLLGMAWQGRILAIFMSSAAMTILGVLILLISGKLKLSIKKSKYISGILRFGLPLIPNALSGWALNMIDRLFLTNMLGLEATGLYSVGYAFGAIIMLIQTAFSRAWLPYFFSTVKEEKEQSNLKLVRITYIYTLLIVALALLVGFVGPWLLRFVVAKEYQEAAQFILWVALGYAANGIYKMLVGYLLYTRKVVVISLIAGVEAAVNALLNYILISRYGAIGAAYATFAAFLCGVFLVFYFSNRYHPMPWFSKEVFFQKG